MNWVRGKSLLIYKHLVHKQQHLFYQCMFLLVFAVLTTLLFLAVPTPQGHLEIDSHGYERLATHFEQTGQLLDPLKPTCHPIQTLGYPLFLGLVYKVFGHSYGWIVFLQMLLAIACGLMLYSLTTRMVNTTTGLIVLGLWSINLGFLVYVQFLLTEMLLVTFLIAFLERFFAYWKTKNLYSLYFSGFLLGCSVVVKPAAVLFIIPLVIFLLLFMGGRWQRRVRTAALFALSFYLPVTGYMMSNKLRFEHFNIAPMTDEILYRYFAAKIKAKVEGKSYEDVLQNEQWCTKTDLLDGSGWEASKKFVHEAVWKHPLVIVELWFTNVLKTWLGLFTTQLKVLLDPSVGGGDCSFFKMSGQTAIERAAAYIFYGQVRWLGWFALAEALWTAIRLFLVAVGLWYLWQTKNYTTLVFFVLYLGYFSLITGHDGCCRYRMMIEPVLLVCAGMGISRLSFRKVA